MEDLEARLRRQEEETAAARAAMEEHIAAVLREARFDLARLASATEFAGVEAQRALDATYSLTRALVPLLAPSIPQELAKAAAWAAVGIAAAAILRSLWG